MTYSEFARHGLKTSLLPAFRPGRIRLILAISLTVTVALATSLLSPQHALAEQYHSRLNSLLLKKSSVYLPSRLVIGENIQFIVKAPAGNKVKVLLSPKNEGYLLPNGTALRVGEDVHELSGTVPENGILELKMEMPKDMAGMEGKILYIDAAIGASDDVLSPADLIDSTGRRTLENALVIVKPAERGGPNILPSLPGMSPQLFNQLSTMSQMSGQGNHKQLIDNGDINRDRELDRNPFTRRGIQPGIGQ